MLIISQNPGRTTFITSQDYHSIMCISLHPSHQIMSLYTLLQSINRFTVWFYNVRKRWWLLSFGRHHVDEFWSEKL